MLAAPQGGPGPWFFSAHSLSISRYPAGTRGSAAAEVSANPASEPLVLGWCLASRKKIAKHFPAGDPAERPVPQGTGVGEPPSRPSGQPH